jgi:hypothetical protein
MMYWHRIVLDEVQVSWAFSNASRGVNYTFPLQYVDAAAGAGEAAARGKGGKGKKGTAASDVARRTKLAMALQVGYSDVALRTQIIYLCRELTAGPSLVLP